jgi:hypothetical protein
MDVPLAPPAIVKLPAAPPATPAPPDVPAASIVKVREPLGVTAMEKFTIC